LIFNYIHNYSELHDSMAGRSAVLALNSIYFNHIILYFESQ